MAGSRRVGICVLVSALALGTLGCGSKKTEQPKSAVQISSGMQFTFNFHEASDASHYIRVTGAAKSNKGKLSINEYAVEMSDGRFRYESSTNQLPDSFVDLNQNGVADPRQVVISCYDKNGIPVKTTVQIDYGEVNVQNIFGCPLEKTAELKQALTRMEGVALHGAAEEAEYIVKEFNKMALNDP